MILVAILLGMSGPATDPAGDLNAQRNELLRTYWMIHSSSSCLDPAGTLRFEAADAEMRKLLLTYRESASKQGSWSPPPMFQQQTLPCSSADAGLARFEAEIKSFERALVEE